MDKSRFSIFNHTSLEPLRAQQRHSTINMIQRAYIIQKVTRTTPGRVHYQATSWFAVSKNNAPIESGTLVDLLERHGNTYVVQPTEISDHFSA